MVVEIEEEVGQQYETARNLRRQLRELADTSEQDFLFKDTSPPRRYITLYSMEDGTPFRCPAYRVDGYMGQTMDDGRDRWTTDKKMAPVFRPGAVKCAFARDSELRPLVDELNIAPGWYCRAEHLLSELSAEVHAEHRHPSRWRILQRHLQKVKDDEWRQEQRETTQAMLTLAGARNTTPQQTYRATNTRVRTVNSELGLVPCTVDGCDFKAKNAFGLQAHLRGKHK